MDNYILIIFQNPSVYCWNAMQTVQMTQHSYSLEADT